VRRRLFTTHVIGSGWNAGKQLALRRPNPAFLDGSYEAVIQAAIAEHLYDGAVFYDIGANVGFFSILAASIVGPSGAIYAFEPVPANAASIRQTTRLNELSNIEVFEEAVGESSGRAQLVLTHHIGGAALASAGTPPDMIGMIEVAVTTLDDAIADRGLRPPSLIKIDVEGAELQVLCGMTATLATHRPAILYEIDASTAGGLARKRDNIANFLKAAGYDVTDLPEAYPGIEWHVAHALALPQKKSP
jgi:FkbM family methyltransferase